MYCPTAVVVHVIFAIHLTTTQADYTAVTLKGANGGVLKAYIDNYYPNSLSWWERKGAGQADAVHACISVKSNATCQITDIYGTEYKVGINLMRSFPAPVGMASIICQ